VSLRLIIVGLRRSGTTIFWQTFRQDPRFLCYDEPFNPHLQVLPATIGLKHPEEFLQLVRGDADEFWRRYRPIRFDEELDARLEPAQADYLRWLADRGDDVVIDVTRCHFKLRALRELAPGATLVHLFRPPASHASSHLLPSAPGLRGRVKRRLNRFRFWTRTRGYNGWSFESIIGSDPGSAFGARLRGAGLDPEEIYSMPALGRLLAYWRVAYEEVEREGRAAFGERFVSQSFDAFCRSPRDAVARIYATMGLAMPELDLSRVHPANGPYREGSPRWRRYDALLELPGAC
jgi:hypothetical protein